MDGDESFGRLLRRLRKARDLTQEALARQVYCALDTIKKLEAGVRWPSRQLAAQLADCLGLADDEHSAFLAAARTGVIGATHSPPETTAPMTAAAPSPRPGSLPAQPTPLIGREREIASVCALLRRADVRLVTLTGAGGTGKTRLALQVAAEIGPEFSDGAWFVNLAPLSDRELVATTIAQTLGVRETARPLRDSLQEYLREKQLLLLLDNFEQLLPAAPLLAELLAAAPSCKLLVTSRATLHLAAEQEFPVPPLALPDPRQGAHVMVIASNPAVALFVARAQATQPAFALTQANAAAVVEICRRLDGLPLAIELAAARIKLLPPQSLLARLDQTLKLLTGGPRDAPARQQTMRATIDWSYQLLDAAEQTLFVRLAVFVGGCTLEAVEAVCNADGALPFDVLDGLAALLDKSLLKQEERAAGEPRFTMLETIREYALERLATSGEEAALRRRHALYYHAATIEAGQIDQVTERDITGHALLTELDNLRAALRWAIEQRDAEIAQRISVALVHFSISVAGFPRSEAYALLETILALGDAADPSRAASATWVDVLNAAGWAASSSGEYARAQEHLMASLAICQRLGDRAGMALAQRSLGLVALHRGELMDAQAWAEQSLALCEEGRDLDGIAWSMYDLGHLAFVRGEVESAEPLLTGSLTLFRGQCNEYGCQRALISLGHIARAQEQLGQATRCYQESLSVRSPPYSHNTSETAHALEGLAALSGAQRQAERAGRLFGAAEILRESFGTPLPPVYRAGYERDVAAARAQLDEASFAAAWAAGRAMTLEEAIAGAERIPLEAQSAVGAPPSAPPTNIAPDRLATLTPRERQVLALLATGASNRAIADALVIAERTAEIHVSNILSKLGVTSRTQATAYALAHGLAAPPEA